MNKQQTRAELDAAIEAFKARGGAIQQLPIDATNGMRSTDWKRATRGELPVQEQISDEIRAERRMEEVREAFHCGGTKAVNEVLGG